MSRTYWTIILVFLAVLVVGGLLTAKTLFPGLLPSSNQGTTSQTEGGGATIPSNPSTVTNSTQQGGGNTTTNEQTAASLLVASVSGGTVSVIDFTKDPDTKTTSNIPDSYFLSGGLDPSESGSSFSIMYVSTDQSFTISLWQEPLGDVRRQAEAALIRKLGISQEVACALRYTVLVPYKVNPYYAGKNLGLSFCPGAEALQ